MKARVLNLSPAKRELLSKLLASGVQEPARVIPRQRGPVVPASYGQERIWLLDRLNPSTPIYQISIGLPIAHWADHEALVCNLNALIERHESLRTGFEIVNGKLVQVVAPEKKIELAEIDLSHQPEKIRLIEARRIGSEDARQPFDLFAPPLMRAKLIRLSACSNLLVVTMHHIIADGWSLDVFTRELSILYNASLKRQPSPLPELTLQYADYVLWQRERLTPERTKPEIEYWRQELKGSSPVNFPLDFPRQARASSQGARVFVRFGRHETQKLEALARKAHATLFMVLLSAFQILLARYSGQNDILCGSPFAGRNRPETEGLIGFFLNTVCLRTRIDPDESFLALLERVRDTSLRAHAHQDLPFERLVADLLPHRVAGTDGLFNVMFVLQSAPRQFTYDGDPLEWQFESETAKFDITMSVLETAGGLAGAIEYRTALFKPSRMERMGRHFPQLLRSILRNPETKVNELEMLSDNEREQIAGWNATEASYPEYSCVHDLVTNQALRTPDAIAVRCGDFRMTYADLEARARSIAADLLARDCVLEEPVGVLMGRGPDLLPTLLGIWKAGCAYVPLDPDAPWERTECIIQDSGIKIVLTTAVKSVAVPRQVDAAGSRRLAYILYTSGSTGKPKGVKVEHRSVVNYLTWVNRTLCATAPSLIAATSKLTFDASLKQLFAPLIAGKTVWLIPETVVASPRDLLRTLEEAEAAFTLNCVPWVWSVLLDEMNANFFTPQNLKALLLGGERLTPDLLERTFARFPDLEVWNLYGPTETTANATAKRLMPGDRISVGGPVANTRVLVLDEHGMQAPIGVPGELHIAGDSLARGYWKEPDLTRERFIQSRYGRLYKTGDHVRYNEDGALEFLGRVDRQVKLRGYRIELGEIQAQLDRHPAVRESVVQLATGSLEPRLVAFVETWGKNVTAAELHAFLRSVLPDYMIPAQFMVLAAFPRSPHGKVDLALLSEQNAFAEEKGETYISPRDASEQRLAEIWCAVLHLERVSVRSSFFALGGHSLLVMQVIARIRDAFAVDVSFRTFFDSPIIEDLAKAIHEIRERNPNSAPAAIPRLTRVARRGPNL